MSFRLREFSEGDAAAVDAVALAAFSEYREAYDDWPAFAGRVGAMSALARDGEIVVAASGAELLGAVVYIGPGRPKSPIFDPAWPIMRMLVVKPSARGLGVGHALAAECVVRARRDGASIFALHTSRLMRVVLAMYERMGFVLLREAPTIFGVPYGIYVKDLAALPRPPQPEIAP